MKAKAALVALVCLAALTGCEKSLAPKPATTSTRPNQIGQVLSLSPRSEALVVDPKPKEERQPVGAVFSSTIAGSTPGLPSGIPDLWDRKIIRTCSLDLVVSNLSEAADNTRAVATRYHGYVESVNLSMGDTSRGTIDLRVPSDQLDGAIGELKKGVVRVQGETQNANDYTRAYVDTEAHLRNLKAEESQYIALLQRSGSMRDTLEVTRQLNDVRARIEQFQGELSAMEHQTTLATVHLMLSTPVPVQSTQVQRWPRVHEALADLRDGMANFADILGALLIELPLFAAWVALIALCAALGFRLARWVWRRAMRLFRRSVPAPAPAG